MKITFKRVRIAFTAVLGMAAFLRGIFLSNLHRNETYKRYVSPPLRGSVRFTFLYPNSLDDLEDSSAYSLISGKATALPSFWDVTVRHKPTRWERFVQRTPFLRNMAFPEYEHVVVRVADPSTDLTLHDKIGWQGRSEVRNEMAWWSHSVRVGDRHSHLYFMLRYGTRPGVQAFGAHDKTVTDSFQVLLPGAPVPK